MIASRVGDGLASGRAAPEDGATREREGAMDERTLGTAELPTWSSRAGTDADGARTGEGGTPLDDPRALTILTTEHWSLLSARGLVYNEAFARTGMFLTFLSATLVALGLVATGIGFRREWLVAAAVLLAVDLFIGLATLGRVASATTEDIRCLQGMSRLRHAYHETVPGLEPYFITPSHDDIASILGLYRGAAPGTYQGLVHGLTTTPGMLNVVCAAIAAGLATVLSLLAGASTVVVAVVATLVLVAGMALGLRWMTGYMAAMDAGLESLFPGQG
jgi:hypothetical protein